MEQSGYTGKIKNCGSQMVEAPVKTKAPKAPKMITGGDLRAKKSSR